MINIEMDINIKMSLQIGWDMLVFMISINVY